MTEPVYTVPLPMESLKVDYAKPFTPMVGIKTSYFIDFEAFQHGEERFRIKELCIISETKPLLPFHKVFYPSKPWKQLSVERQKSYSFQTRHLHRLTYDEGEKQYCRNCIYKRIKQRFPGCKTSGVFFVLGKQKLDFLSSEFPKLHFQQYDSAETVKSLRRISLPLKCSYADHGNHCAMLKCFRLYHDFCKKSSYLVDNAVFV